MLENLFKIKETEDWQCDELWVQSIKTAYEDDTLTLTVNILFLARTDALESWLVECKNVRDYKESICEFGEASLCYEQLGFVESYPLLLLYFTGQVALSFLGKPDCVDATVGGLLKAHHGIVRGVFEFSRFLNQNVKSWDLLAGGYGQLAEGPAPLMEAYAQVLEQHGVKPNLTQRRRPSWYGVNGWVEENGKAKLLFLGTGYVIAEKFKATRIK